MSDKKSPSLRTLKKIIETVPTPFHLYLEDELRERARALNRAFSWNAGYREYFAVKANPNPYILEIFREEGCGVDCASLTELMLSEAVGFRGEEIMFSSNETPGAEYEAARRLGAIVNLDDESHIDFLKEHGGIPETISLRFNPGGEISFGNTVMGKPAESKFGMTEAQIFKSAEKLMRLGAKRFCLHAFLVSNALDERYYPGMARLLFRLSKLLKEQLGADVAMVNLSGGIGIPYRPEESAVDIQRVGEAVRREYESYVSSSDMEKIRLSTEMGRYMSGPAGYLIATAIHEKNTYKHYIGLDACAADLMRPAMYGAYHHVTVAGKEAAPRDHIYDLVGSLCENNDKFAVDRPLPKIDIGDIVVLHDTGAHGHSMGYNYNGKLRSAEVLLKSDGSFQLIRRAETPEDYFATLNYKGLSGKNIASAKSS